MPDKILLIDSNSLMHRAYHALPQLKSSKGQYTGAVYGFLSLFLKLVKEQQPTHIAAAFDLPGKTFRHLMYPDYKGQRKPMDPELACQVQPLKNLITAMGIKIVSMEGYEGDDILGTLSKRFDAETIIVTGDRDSFQLVSPSTKIFWTKKGVTDIEVYDEARLLEDGFTVPQYIDYKAMRGDTSDNIPGIPGVGEKTAKDLLEKYESLDGVYENIDVIKGKLHDTILNNKELAYLSRELSVIKTDVPVECSLDDIAFTPVYSQDVKRMLQELEITSLSSRMEFDEQAVSVGTSRIVERITIEKEVREIRTKKEMSEAMTGDEVAVLIGSDVRFACDMKTEYLIATKADLFSDGLDFEEAVEALAEITSKKTIICYDYKSLAKKYGFTGSGFFDIMIAAHLARGSATIKGIEAVLAPDGFETGACEMMAEKEMLDAQMTNNGVKDLFMNIETPLCAILKNMEERGVCVSTDALKALENKYQKKIDELTETIYDMAGCRFNIASPRQLGDILFDKMQLPTGKKTKSGYSVNEDVLEGLIPVTPIASVILEYRHYTKLQSTYVVGLQPLIVGGRIHTEYNQCITMTGRLSSTNPNLQNIPARSEEADDIKKAFLPSPGNILVSADYSQIELRLLAHMSGDEQLIEAFKNGDDIHALTASQIFGIPLEEVTSQQRREAKAVNFGIIYGISGFGLAENLDISRVKAKSFIDNYFISHPKVKEFMNNCVESARKTEKAVTMYGRIRNLQDINSSNYMVRNSVERMAMNTPVQGSAADIIKLAMIGVENRLKDKKSKMILQIHDELVIDTAPDEKEEVMKILQEEMEHAAELNVPLVAEAGCGNNWGELK